MSFVPPLAPPPVQKHVRIVAPASLPPTFSTTNPSPSPPPVEPPAPHVVDPYGPHTIFGNSTEKHDVRLSATTIAVAQLLDDFGLSRSSNSLAVPVVVTNARFSGLVHQVTGMPHGWGTLTVTVRENVSAASKTKKSDSSTITVFVQTCQRWVNGSAQGEGTIRSSTRAVSSSIVDDIVDPGENSHIAVWLHEGIWRDGFRCGRVVATCVTDGSVFHEEFPSLASERQPHRGHLPIARKMITGPASCHIFPTLLNSEEDSPFRSEPCRYLDPRQRSKAGCTAPLGFPNDVGPASGILAARHKLQSENSVPCRPNSAVVSGSAAAAARVRERRKLAQAVAGSSPRKPSHPYLRPPTVLSARHPSRPTSAAARPPSQTNTAKTARVKTPYEAAPLFIASNFHQRYQHQDPMLNLRQLEMVTPPPEAADDVQNAAAAVLAALNGRLSSAVQRTRTAEDEDDFGEHSQPAAPVNQFIRVNNSTPDVLPLSQPHVQFDASKRAHLPAVAETKATGNVVLPPSPRIAQQQRSVEQQLSQLQWRTRGAWDAPVRIGQRVKVFTRLGEVYGVVRCCVPPKPDGEGATKWQTHFDKAFSKAPATLEALVEDRHDDSTSDEEERLRLGVIPDFDGPGDNHTTDFFPKEVPPSGFFPPEAWTVGIECDVPQPGGNDGSILTKGTRVKPALRRRYFWCEPGHGLIMPGNQVRPCFGRDPFH